MGTNYYVIKGAKPSEIKEKINEIIDNDKDNVYNIVNRIKDFLENNVLEIHIGKSSCGWKFLFNHNNEEYYNKTRDSIDKFIRENTLFDEYGKIQDPDDFWKFVDSKKDGIDNKDYYTKNPNLYVNVSHYYEEYSDGLRFSTSTEFR